ncbi:MAG TPA: hypothetical protein VF594_10980, partial [Rubricoccaceae bacterium]
RASRLTDPDLALRDLRQRETLPQAIRDLLAQPVLDELSRLLSAGEAQQAFSLAARHTQALNENLQVLDDPTVASALVSHRQRLLFAAATSASWLGDVDRARGLCRDALALGPVEADRVPQATTALFNASLPDDLRRLIGTIADEDPHRALADGLLAYLEGDWETADARLPESDSADVLLIRAQARIALLDPLDLEMVRRAEALLDAADESQPLDSGRILAVRATVDLAQAVMDGQTPLAYDRRPLADAVHRRTLRALAAVPPGTALHARAVAAASRAASVLRDDGLARRVEAELAAIPDTVQDEVFVRLDALETPVDVEALRTEGLIEAVQAIRMTAGMYENAGDVDRADGTLRNALFASADPKDRIALLNDLVRLLRRNGRFTAADQILDVTPVPDAERWTLRAQHADGVPNLHEAQAFSLHVGVVGLVSHRLIAARAAGDAEPVGTPADDGLGASPVAWARRLVALVPSPSSRLTHAEALFLDGQHDTLLTVLDDVGATDLARLAELRAFALEGLGRRGEGADGLAQFAREHPQAVRASVNASALLLRDGRPAEAVALLDPLEAAGSPSAGVLTNLGRALLAQAPHDRHAASRAFDLLVRAYDARPVPAIAREAWKAARGANREAEGSRFFLILTQDAANVEVQTLEDIDAANDAAEGELVQFSGGTDALVDYVRRDRERTAAIGRALRTHGIAYADAFRAGGRAWQNWSSWTLLAEQTSGGSGFAVLADWPSSAFTHQRHHPEHEAGLFADLTALLTLGLLGSDVVAQMLDALGTLYVSAGTLDRLVHDLGVAETDVLVGGPQVADAVAHLRHLPAARVEYSQAVEDAAPDDESLGAARIDLGAAEHVGAPYVTDLDDAQSVRPAVSSRVVLATLVADGLVTAAAADAAAAARPSAYREWREVTPLDALPDALVFDPFAFVDLVSADLHVAVGARVRVGPWGWRHLLDEAHHLEARVSAHGRIAALIDVLRPRAADGRLVELDLVREPRPPRGDASNGERQIEAVWSE